MKKICFFISSITLTGGTERVCSVIANKLSQLGYQVIILSMYGEKPFFELEENVKVISVFRQKHTFKLFLPIVILKLRKSIKTINPDVLINADSALYIYSLVAGFRFTFKNIVWEHFNFHVSLNTIVRGFSRKLAAKYSDAIITLTHKDNNNWKRNLSCKAPVYTINNPLPFNNSTYNDNLRKPVVLSVGRLTFQKGFDRLIDVWNLLKSNGYQDWELHIVGSGELKENLVHQIDTLNLAGSVKLISATDKIEEHYKQASIYCMTSRFEGFGMVLIEAQSFGLPVVSYDCEAGPSEIINSENGILVEDGDKQALVNALTYLMVHEEVRLKIGVKAFENSSNYNIDVIIKKWLNLFEVDLNYKVH
ncbi:MAG: glycosyltransferase family 4 protein [Janthinobacterium lividum]